MGVLCPQRPYLPTSTLAGADHQGGLAHSCTRVECRSFAIRAPGHSCVHRYIVDRTELPVDAIIHTLVWWVGEVSDAVSTCLVAPSSESPQSD